MTLRDTGAYPATEIEGLIAALTGVRAARVTLSDVGRVQEIHVLAEPRTHPKQIVRNVESALSAGLGVTVDRRYISVAQVKDEPEPEEPPAAEAAHPEPAVADVAHHPEPAAADVARHPEQLAAAQQSDASIGRYIFVGYDARTQPDLETDCRVTIRHQNAVFSGNGEGPSTPLGRAQAAARAVFDAIATARESHSLDLEGVTLVESHGRTYVLVAAHAITGRSTVALTGAAALHRSPEEAAILASLQATNRWNELSG
jgi:hypothetical protein